MNFLAPLFLLGALAIAAPVLFHLIRRTTRDKTRFSSLLFLQPDPPRLTQRSRIENWLLLLLRAAALALLALAFARPFIRTASPLLPESAGTRRIVILVDTSASMKRTGLTEAAKEKAAALLRTAQPGDQLALWTFDHRSRRLMEFAEWSTLAPDRRAATAIARLEEVKPAWGNTRLSTTLTEAAELLAEGPAAQGRTSGGEIVLLSDLQEGSRLDGLQGWEWPQDVKVTAVPLSPNQPGNAGLQLAPALGETPAGPPRPPEVRVRVWNSPDHTTSQFQIGWTTGSQDSFTSSAQDITVPPGQSRVVALPWSPNLSSALRLKGDAGLFDNTVFATPPTTVEITAHYFGTESLADSKQPLYFLNPALPATPQVTVKLNLISPESTFPVILPNQPALFFANGALPTAQATFLRQQLESGRTGLISLTGPEAAPALATLAGVPVDSLRLETIKPPTYGMLSEINFQHPLFAPFADPRFSDFTKIRFWHYTKYQAEALPRSRVLAKFDSGDPALTEVPVGQGRLLVLASGWHPSASQLALSTKFVPLLSSLLEWSGAAVIPPSQFINGEPVPLRLLGLTGDGPVTVRLPDGTDSTLPAGTLAFTATGQPGLYAAKMGSLTKPFAVNLDPAESRTTPLSADELDRLGVPVQTTPTPNPTKSKASPSPAVEAESRQKLWRWLIAAALAVLLIETFLAGLTARRSLTSGDPAV